MIGPITDYNKGYLDGIDYNKKHPSVCPICKGFPCILKGTPISKYISGAHIKNEH